MLLLTYAVAAGARFDGRMPYMAPSAAPGNAASPGAATPGRPAMVSHGIPLEPMPCGSPLDTDGH